LSKLIQENQDLTKEQTEDCMMFHSAWNSLAKTWTLPVIHALGLKQPARFNELKRRIHGVSATSLAERLHELEQRKIIERKVYPETPPRNGSESGTAPGLLSSRNQARKPSQ